MLKFVIIYKQKYKIIFSFKYVNHIAIQTSFELNKLTDAYCILSTKV